MRPTCSMTARLAIASCTHATAALVLHALDHCQAARNLLADTITTHQREYPGHPATARMTRHLARIWDECTAKGHHHPDA